MKILWRVIAMSAASLTAACSYQPLFTPAEINPAVTITETRRTIEIRPAVAEVSKTGLLFYPGGLVDSHVYSELLADFAETVGVVTVVVKMPANLAVFDIDAGISVISEYPGITQWVIAGHSLGGAMAAATVSLHPEEYEGLIFMDSYPADGNGLAEWPGAVLSLYSSVEKVNDTERMRRTLELIPPAIYLTESDRTYPPERTNYTVIHQIDGGSHSFFGTYGPQDGDYPPTITREAFHEEVIDYVAEFFTENGWGR